MGAASCRARPVSAPGNARARCTVSKKKCNQLAGEEYAPRPRLQCRLQAKVERGRVTHIPKPVVDRAIAEGLEDVRKGRVRGPFNTVDETINSLEGRY